MPIPYVFSSPEEFNAAVQEHERMHKQSHTSNYNDLHRFIDELTKEHLIILMDTLVPLIMHQQDSGAFFIGIIEQRLREHFDFCRCTGQDHNLSDHDDPDWVINQMVSPELEAVQATEDTVMVENTLLEHALAKELPMLALMEDNPKIVEEHIKELGTEVVRKSFDELLSVFDLILIRDEDFERDPTRYAGYAYKCGNCGKGYISLEDRMLQKAGIAGCEGCQYKSKHG
jgi:hypothetical protein